MAALRLIPAWAGKTHRQVAHEAAPRAHPRVGGENAASTWGGAEFPGSSPRGRGKLATQAVDTLRRGLIPAWAGKTSDSSGRYAPQRAHPRVGGENSIFSSWTRPSSGSSPRGRGKPRSPITRLHERGLIPAWAGKTQIDGNNGTHGSAHPRVGGENVENLLAGRARDGSSPRGRGKHAHEGVT